MLNVGGRFCIRFSANNERAFIARVTASLSSPGSLLNSCWLPEIDRIRRPSALQLLDKLTSNDPTGYDAGSGKAASEGVIKAVRAWKQEHPDKVILLRIGEFFEAFGLDAVLLVEHAALNPMGSKARAGCPRGNLPHTLKALTDAGLSVAVYEEANAPDLTGPLSLRRKVRFLSQVVTPGMPTYLSADLSLRTDAIPYQPARPFCFIRKDGTGYGIALIQADSKEVKISDSLTEDALVALLEGSGGVAEPIFLAEGLQVNRFEIFLPRRRERVPGSGGWGVGRGGVLGEVVNRIRRELALPSDSLCDLRVLTGGEEKRMQPLYRSAALALGLAQGSVSPPLASALIPADSPSYAFRFLTRWLLAPPNSTGREAMRELLVKMRDFQEALPLFRPVPVEKLVRLLEAGLGNPTFFLEIRACISGVKDALKLPGAHQVYSIAQTVSGVNIGGKGKSSDEPLAHYEKTLAEVIATIDKDVVISSWPNALNQADLFAFLPAGFIDSNESAFRSSVRLDYRKLDISRSNLEQALLKDLSSELEAVHDAVNNRVSLRARGGKNLKNKKNVLNSTLEAATDRKGEKISGRFTTLAIEKALREYLRETNKLENEARQRMHALCKKLGAWQKELILASHWSVIASTATLHLEQALRRGWCFPEICETGSFVEISRLTPYWLDPPPRGTASPSSVCLKLGEGPTVLTAPNMSGKSTFIRSIAAASLLANCGFLVPAESAKIAVLKNILIVSPGGDRPVEGLSAFAAEAEAIAVALRDANPKETPEELVGSKTTKTRRKVEHPSLVLVDEFGRGTSPLDGVALTGALLELFQSWSSKVGCVFATHLHEIFSLNLPEIIWWRMDGHSVEIGKCFDSLGIDVAENFGVPKSVGSRARIIRESLLKRDIDQGREIAGHSERKKTEISSGFPDLDIETLAATFAAVLPTPPLRLAPEQTPPPSLQAKAVVYALLLTGNDKALQVYIGETENFSKRILAHKKKFDTRLCCAWVVGVTGKGEARVVETALIRALEKFPGLISRADGRRRCSVV